MIGLSYNESDFDGQNLVPMMKGDQTSDLIAYIESGPANEKLEGKVIGLRSLHYKYFRSRSNPNNMIHLYALTEDPLELHNIADVNIEIVENMEAKLQNFLKMHLGMRGQNMRTLRLKLKNGLKMMMKK